MKSSREHRGVDRYAMALYQGLVSMRDITDIDLAFPFHTLRKRYHRITTLERENTALLVESEVLTRDD